MISIQNTSGVRNIHGKDPNQRRQTKVVAGYSLNLSTPSLISLTDSPQAGPKREPALALAFIIQVQSRLMPTLLTGLLLLALPQLFAHALPYRSAQQGAVK